MKPFVLCAFLTAAGLLEGQTTADGIAAVEAGRFQDAERILSELLRRDPGSFEANLYLGLTHFRAGNSAAARPLLEQAVRLSPASAQAWKMLGLVATSQGDLEPAVAALEKACDLGPKDEEACYYLGRDLYALGHYEAARTPFEKALGAVPQGMPGRVHRAIALNFAAQGLPVEAESHFKKAILAARPPTEGEDVRIDYGAFLFRQGRTEEAVPPLQQAVHDVPKSARANLELGRVLLHTDKLNDAVSCLERAVALDPANPNGHLLLGRAYLRLERTSDGEREMRLGQGSGTEKR